MIERLRLRERHELPLADNLTGLQELGPARTANAALGFPGTGMPRPQDFALSERFREPVWRIAPMAVVGIGRVRFAEALVRYPLGYYYVLRYAMRLLRAEGMTTRRLRAEGALSSRWRNQRSVGNWPTIESGNL